MKSSEDIVSMEKDASGTFTVTCKNGTKEYKVAMSQIQSNEVCKAAPPQGASSIIADFNGTYTVMCKDGTIEHAVTKARVDSGDYCGQKSQPPQGVTQVNPKAFNAYSIWRDGQGSEILDYPQGYDDGWDKETTKPDGVFYDTEDYWKKTGPQWYDTKFIGVPTEGAKVVDDVLEYPVKNGKRLKLKFTAESSRTFKHADAVTHCKKQDLRLPILRELFDFCVAGTLPNAEGVFVNHRCRDYPWSASVYPGFNAAHFGILLNTVGDIYRDSRFGVRCVGPAQ